MTQIVRSVLRRWIFQTSILSHVSVGTRYIFSSIIYWVEALDVSAVGEAELSTLEAEARVPFAGSFMDAFPALKPHPSPQLHQVPTVYPHNPARSIYDPLAMRESYLGSFNPFGETEGPTTGGGARSPPSGKAPQLQARLCMCRPR